MPGGLFTNDFDTAIFPRNVCSVPRGKIFASISVNMILSREFYAAAHHR